jgi:hypothetical protein
MFVAKPGWKQIQLLFCRGIAALSRDKQLLFAIEQGMTFSYSSFLMFGMVECRRGSAEPVGKPPTKKLQTLEKSKTFSSLTLRYRVVFSENSNVPTSEGSIGNLFQNIPQL